MGEGGEYLGHGEEYNAERINFKGMEQSTFYLTLNSSQPYRTTTQPTRQIQYIYLNSRTAFSAKVLLRGPLSKKAKNAIPSGALLYTSTSNKSH